MELKGSDIVMECLLEQGVDTVFGYPGGSILNIYDSLYHYQKKIRHILTAHEQGAAHAADGYARSTGKVGVVFATSGPGATNLVTGIATAYMDSVPMVAITCNVSTSLLGKDTFQEVDILSMTMPITKHNYLVKKAEDIAPSLRKAFQIAASGRPGPVLVDITKDATGDLTEYERKEKELPTETPLSFDQGEVKKVLRLLEKSKRPLIYAGGGIISANAERELKMFQEKLDAPLTLSLMGLGGFPADDPAFTGMIGMHGSKVTSLAIKECDLLIAVGTRFSDRVTCSTETFAKGAKILHLDVDAAEINKNVMTDGHLVGDAGETLSLLCEKMKPQHHEGWMKKIEEWKKKFPSYTQGEKGLTPEMVIRTLYQATGGDAIVTTDVGQHQMWTAQYYPFRQPRRFVTSGGLGTMGFGLGAAIGAQIGNPTATVINVTGDGCFHMNMNELSTAAQEELPILEVIMNNQSLGMVRQWQRVFYEKRYSCTTLEKKTDYEGVSRALGARAFTVTCREELTRAVEEALACRHLPTVIHCIIDPDEAVLPMVPADQSIEEPILEIKKEAGRKKHG